MKCKKWLKQYDLPIIITVIFIAFIIYSIFVRFQGLGYSGFQGDEVNPMTFLYGMEDGVIPYLLEHKRGPMQYVINILNVSVFGYHNEFQIRLPFFIFGVLALFTIYKLASRVFDKTVALTAVTFMAANGLFIAFARITQYQSFMYFLIPIGVLLFIKALDKKSTKLFLFAGLIMALALLAHYDTLSVMPFFIVGFVGKFFRDIYKEENRSSKFVKKTTLEYIKYSLIFFLAMMLPALAYYIPFYFGSYFDSKTSGYLENRLLGGGLMPRTKITLKLLTMYIPRFHSYFLFLFGAISLLFFAPFLREFKIKKFSISKKIVQYAYIAFVLLFVFAAIFSLYHVKPRASSLLVIGSAMTISFLLTFAPKLKWTHASLATWFLGAFSFYFFIMKDPRTHVYVTMIPLFILVGYAFIELYRSMKPQWLKAMYLTITVLMFAYISTVNWTIFVDKSPEYPWWDKDDVFGNPIYRLKRVRHEKIEGVFGFNNYRAWDQVADLYEKGCLIGTHNSNEKDSITYFYIREHQAQGDLWDLDMDADNLIVVEGPHSWVYDAKARIPNNHTLLKTIYSEGVPVSYIYGRNSVYKDGKLLCDE